MKNEMIQRLENKLYKDDEMIQSWEYKMRKENDTKILVLEVLSQKHASGSMHVSCRQQKMTLVEKIK